MRYYFIFPFPSPVSSGIKKMTKQLEFKFSEGESIQCLKKGPAYRLSAGRQGEIDNINRCELGRANVCTLQSIWQGAMY